ncbi:Bax inhibitor-1 family protein [Stutzerimonas zhaodongensis]|uniref:Bax inhibitor-1 family protein n=1 Tax=Stutzerimonas TaxID=2901164 RepID=UPI00388DAB5A
MENSVFARRPNVTDRTVSAAVYNLLIGLTLCWGFLVNWWMVVHIPVEPIRSIDPLLFFGGYFACCLAGIYLFQRSNQPWISFLGYNLVVLPFGLVVNLVVSRYDANLVQEAIRVTALVTVAMMVAGTLFPQFFERIAGALTVALLAVIVIELFEMFILGVRHGAIDWIVVLIFCGYIGVDWGRANRIPKTVDNAIDSAAALYMDMINLFIRILRILGRK